jgi:cytochrome bd-type quinol oxidase subunit 2
MLALAALAEENTVVYNIATLTIVIAGVAGVLAPLLTAVFQAAKWSDSTKMWISQAIALVITLVLVFVVGHPKKIDDWVAAFAVIATLQQIAYQAIWKPLGITQAISANTFPGLKNGSAVSESQPPETPGE